jgi:hypothetical protein
MRRVSEKITLTKLTPEAAFERVLLRSLDADSELRGAEGGGLSDAEFAERMGLRSRETIRQYRGKGRIFGWLKGSRRYRYPAWQIHRKELLPGLAEVLAVLNEKELHSLSIIGYFLTPKRRPGRRQAAGSAARGQSGRGSGRREALWRHRRLSG